MNSGITAIRNELKYLVPVERVHEVVARVPRGTPCRFTRMTTLYFDRPDGSLSRAALADPARSVKIRARDYLDGSPFVWVEIKRRFGTLSEKLRFEVYRPVLANLVNGEEMMWEILRTRAAETRADAVVKAYRALRALSKEKLVPVGAVCATRQAFTMPWPRLRLSVDREVLYFAAPPDVCSRRDPLTPQALGRPLAKDPHSVIEIKFGGFVPRWCRNVFEGLAPCDHSKFRSLVRLVREVA